MKMDQQMMVETEEVRVGNWRSRLPSDVCTNRQIFNEIFSLNTWNNVLNADQQERLIKLLPKEIASSPEATKQTVEDLFNGSLTTFAQNPVSNFFEQLEKGQYDPDVIDTKINIMREWKKESLRQLKCYHTRLLEDIVVSRQRHLNKIKESIITSSKIRKPATKSKKPISTVLQNASSELNSKSSTKPTPIIKAIKQENDSNLSCVTNNGTKKRKIKEEPMDADVQSPAPKKATLCKGINQNVVDLDNNSQQQTVVSPLQPLLSSTPKATNFGIGLVGSNSTPISKILSSQSTILPSRSNASSISTDNSILSSALTSNKTSNQLTQILKSNSSSYTSPTLTSPILASQLASPQVSVKVEDSLGLFSSESCSITLNYQSKIEDKSSDDDLETSSDEFEAIQPTIGFGTTVPSTMTGILSPTPQTTNQITSNAMNPVTYSGAFSNKLIQIQQQPDRFIAVSGNSNTSQPNPVYFVSAKNFTTLAGSNICLQSSPQQGRLIPISKGALELPLSNQILSSKLVSSENITDIKPSIIKIEKDITQTHSTLLDQLIQKPVSTLSGSNFPVHTEFLRIPNSSGELSGKTILAKAGGATLNSAGVHCISTSTGKSLILHSIPNISTSTKSSPLMPNISSHSYSSNMQFISSQSRMTMTMSADNLGSMSNSNNNLLDNDELNLNLGMGLGANISIGGPLLLDSFTGGDVIDKIDDLSVLDGNPFDSIPNLSDELDGLDLDLVDGLCDFDGLLSDEKKYPSFFSLIRDVLCSTRDHRMNLMCLEKTIRKWTTSPGAALNQWFVRVSDWNNALVTALNFLAGTYQDVHPEDFVPYIEYKYKTKYYQWIGAGRDGDNNLTPLCSIWMDNLEKLPSVKKIDGETEDQEEDDEENEDSELAGEDAKKKNKRPQTPPPPRCVTDWSVRPSTDEEKNIFRKQERTRFENPHKAFTYTMHGYESVVGPVKGVYSSQVGMTNKARGHSLLVDDRPPYVTILALVRDAVARLPNGEGTRSEICEMLRDSAFLAPDASSVTLNSVVSGALDRLHYERDPCVRYDSHKKSWIYLHRDRTQEQFERLHHNRSYTKSTKSRNNSARKSRRSTGKGPNLTPPSTGTSSTGIISSITGSNDETGHLTPTSTSCSSGHDSMTDTLSQGIPAIQESPPTLPCTTQNLISSNVCVVTSSTVVVTTSSIVSLPTLRLTSISSSSESGAPTTHYITTTADSSGIGSQFLVQTASTPVMTSVTSQNTIHFQPGRSIQVQAIPVSRPNNITAENSTNLPQGITSQQTTATTPQQGQIMFAPSTVLRLANALRLSQLRLPGNNTLSGNLRLPQHRILLTRGAVPGQTQTQGILLGQTSTGQTVILSTTPQGFQTLQPMTNASQLQELNTSVSSDVETSSTAFTLKSISSTPSVDTVQGIPISGASLCPNTKAPTINVGNNIFDVNTSKILHLNIAGGQSPFTKSSLVTTTPTTVTMSQSFPTSSEFLTVTTGANTFNLNTTVPAGSIQRQPMGYTIATVRGNTVALPTRSMSTPTTLQLQNLNQPLNTQSTNQNIVATTTLQDNPVEVSTSSHSQLTSPIIIRSVQGDIMLPGHIALGKGVQGIKLIPLPMGNKTVLATKIIPRMALSTTTSTTSNNPSQTFAIAKSEISASSTQNLP